MGVQLFRCPRKITDISRSSNLRSWRTGAGRENFFAEIGARRLTRGRGRAIMNLILPPCVKGATRPFFAGKIRRKRARSDRGGSARKTSYSLSQKAQRQMRAGGHVRLQGPKMRRMRLAESFKNVPINSVRAAAQGGEKREKNPHPKMRGKRLKPQRVSRSMALR